MTGTKVTDKELDKSGFAPVGGLRDTLSKWSVWQKRDLIAVRDDRTNVVISLAALDSYGQGE